jgi:hypothetical protein
MILLKDFPEHNFHKDFAGLTVWTLTYEIRLVPWDCKASLRQGLFSFALKPLQEAGI